jgi:O-antigen/teichoic acid export membrane protein
VSAGGARALSYFIYARLLTPTDFGLVGFCTLLVGLFPLLIDNSLGLALIRHERGDQRTFSAVFHLNVGLSIVAITVLCIGARWAAHLLNDPRAAVLLPVLSIQLLFNALCSSHIAIAQRRFRYRTLVPVRLFSTFCSLVAGLLLAFLGCGYWSLAIASIVASLSQMAAAWVLLGWRPSLEFDWPTAKSILGFGSRVAVDMGVTWLVISGGGFFLAFFLGAHDLGLFRLSDQIDTYLLGAVLSPLIPVFYSAFCEVSSDPEEWRRFFARTIRVVAMIASALAGGIVVAAHPLEAMIGTKWQGVGAILGLNAIADGISYATLPTPSLMRAQGRAGAVAAMRIVMVMGQVVVYSLAAPHGLQVFVIGKLGLEIAMYFLSFGVLRAAFAMPIGRLIGSQVTSALGVAVSAIVGVAVASKAASLGVPTSLAVGLVLFCVLTGIYLSLTDRQSVQALFKNSMSRKVATSSDDARH